LDQSEQIAKNSLIERDKKINDNKNKQMQVTEYIKMHPEESQNRSKIYKKLFGM
jgi:hypothetical protein